MSGASAANTNRETQHSHLACMHLSGKWTAASVLTFVHLCLCICVYVWIVMEKREEKVSVWLHSSRRRKSNGWTVSNEADNRAQADPEDLKGRRTREQGLRRWQRRGKHWISWTVTTKRAWSNVRMHEKQRWGCWPNISNHAKQLRHVTAEKFNSNR